LGSRTEGPLQLEGPRGRTKRRGFTVARRKGSFDAPKKPCTLFVGASTRKAKEIGGGRHTTARNPKKGEAVRRYDAKKKSFSFISRAAEQENAVRGTLNRGGESPSGELLGPLL